MAAKNITTINSGIASKYGKLDAEYTNPATDEAWESVNEYVSYKNNKRALVPKHKTILVRQEDGTNAEMTNENQDSVNDFIVNSAFVISGIIGKLRNLNTTNKSTVVDAINELANKISNIENGGSVNLITSWEDASDTNSGSAKLVYDSLRDIINRVDELEAIVLSVDIYDCGTSASEFTDIIDCGSASTEYNDIIDFNE